MAGGSSSGHSRAERVAVVGSLNLDLIVRVPRAPVSGETILATAYGEHPGGKGHNQAVAAAALVPTAIVGAVGGDEAGRILLASARARGVDVDPVTVGDVATGRALITLHPDGDNTIVVAALANLTLDPNAVVAELERLAPGVVLTQFEIPSPVVSAVAAWALSAGARLIVNPSPLRDVEERVLAAADPLIVNVGEAIELLSATGPLETLARRLAVRARSVVVTAGAQGAVVADARGTFVVPAPVVSDVRDSSGAGDAFAGTLAARLALGDALDAAARVAAAEASRVVARAREDR